MVLGLDGCLRRAEKIASEVNKNKIREYESYWLRWIPGTGNTNSNDFTEEKVAPNYVAHQLILKPFSACTTECVNDFSRKII